MPSIAEQAELIEAEAMYRVVASAPPDLKRKFNVTARRIGGGVVLAAAGTADPSGFWSKALGLGISEPVTAALIAEICAFFRSCGAELATVQIAPAAMPPDWAEIAARHGLRAGIRWAKLTRPALAIDGAAPVTTLRVTQVPPDHLDPWSRVFLAGFGVDPEIFGPMLAAAAPQGFEPFAAWDGQRLAAAGALFLQGNGAQLIGASTLPSYRRQGAQSALLRARIERAIDSGASWISTEATAGDNGQSSSSLNNAERAGFQVRYVRDSWTWQAEPCSLSAAPLLRELRIQLSRLRPHRLPAKLCHRPLPPRPPHPSSPPRIKQQSIQRGSQR